MLRSLPFWQAGQGVGRLGCRSAFPGGAPSRRKTAWPRCPSPLVKPPAAPALPALAGGCWLLLASATKMIRFAAGCSAHNVYTFHGCGWWVGVVAGGHVFFPWLASSHPAACCRPCADELAWVLDVTFTCRGLRRRTRQRAADHAPPNWLGCWMLLSPGARPSCPGFRWLSWLFPARPSRYASPSAPAPVKKR